MTQSGSPLVLTDVRDAVATLTFNRPDERNAWSPEQETALFDALEAAEVDPDVRAIVVTGSGGAFGVGPKADVLDPDSLSELARDARGDAFPTTLSKPIIAAIDGPCVGIALSTAMMCDVRFVSADAKLTTGFVKVGLIAEHGTAWLLQRLGSPAVALDLLLTARVVRGVEAQSLGLANFVVDDDVLGAAQAYARRICASSSPSAMAVIKSQVYACANSELLDAVAESDRLVVEAAASADFAEGIAALSEGRAPQFSTTNQGAG